MKNDVLERAGRTAEAVLQWMPALCVLVLPALFDPGCMDSFALPKTAALRMIAAIAVSALIIRTWAAGKLEWKQSWATPLLAALLVSLSWATWKSESWNMGWHGLYAFKADGLAQWYAYACLYLTALLASGYRAMRRAYWAWTAAALAIGVYGIFQYFGFDPVRWNLDPRGARVWSTFGNANFLGAYLAMSLPVLLALLLEPSHSDPSITHQEINLPAKAGRLWRLTWARISLRKILPACALLISVWVLALTLSRAAWLAAFIGIFVCATLAGMQRLRARGKALAAVGGAVLAVSLLFPWGDLFGRARSGLDLDQPEWKLRLYGWKAAAELLGEHPFGLGADGYHRHFQTHMPKEFYRLSRNTMLSPVYPHNEILQTGVHAGLAGLVFYLMVLAVLAACAWNTRGSIWAAGAAGVLAASFVNNQFSFHTVATASLFWLAAGTTVFLAAKTRTIYLPDWTRKPAITAIVLAVAGFLALAGGWKAARLYEADALFRRAVIFYGRADKANAVRVYQKLWRVNPSEPHYLHRFAALGLELAKEYNDAASRSQFLNSTAGTFRKIIALNPRDALALNGLGTVYAMAHRHLRASTAQQAEDYFQKALKVNPYLVEAWSNLGALYHGLGKTEQAVQAYLKAKDIDPYNPQVYYNLGVLHALNGDLNAAQDYWNETLELDSGHPDARRALNMLASGELGPRKQGGAR